MTALLDVAPFALAALLVLGTPALALLAVVRTNRLRRRVAVLEAQVARRAVAGAASTAGQPEAEPAAPGPSSPEPEPLVLPDADAGPPPEPAARSRPSLETRLAERWLVWLGAGALGLGGLFAAGYAVEAGLLGPAVRVIMAALLGLALVALAIRLRGRDVSDGRPDHVPPALAAGGLVALYGAAAAAHALYGLVEPPVAFALLALVAALGVSLGLVFGGPRGPRRRHRRLSRAGRRRHRPSLGLGALLLSGGGGCEPGDPRRAGRLALARLAEPRRRVFWALLWLVARAGPGDILPMAGFAFVVALAGLWTLVRRAQPEEPAGRWSIGRRPSRALIGAMLLLLVLVMATVGFTAAGVATLALLSLACLAAGLLRPEERRLAAAAATADLLAAAAWDIPTEALTRGAPSALDAALDPLTWVAPAAQPLAWALALIGAFWAVAGSIAAWRGQKPGFWAGLAVAVPLAALGVAFWRLAGLAPSPPLVWAALALAALDLALAERAARRPSLRPALAAYAVGVAGALALGAAIMLEAGWLTLALAAELPAMGWVALRLELFELRRPARWLATLVLVRAGLGLDPALLDTGRGALAALWTCGGPMLLMGLAARLFRRQREDGLVALLEGGALLFWLLLILRVTRAALGDPRREPCRASSNRAPRRWPGSRPGWPCCASIGGSRHA